MSFKQMREAREEAYGRKVPGIRAFFSFWMPAIFLLKAWGVAGYVTGWSGDTAGFILTLLCCFCAAAATILGRFWDIGAFASALSALAAILVSLVRDLINSLFSFGSLSSAVSDATGESGAVGQMVGAWVNAGAGIAMASVILACLVWLTFVCIYLAIFIKHRRLFFVDAEMDQLKNQLVN